MMGTFLMITMAVVVCNLLVDLLYPLVDPRIASPGASRRLERATMPTEMEGPQPLGEGQPAAAPVGGSMA
jgi:peptide/nickel transport system permease protein